MTDAGRKSATDSISESVTPDSQKSTLDKASETVSGTADKITGAVQPEDSKSTTQKASDTVSGSTSSDAESTGKSYIESAQDTVSSGIKSAQDALSGDNLNEAGAAWAKATSKMIANWDFPPTEK